MLYVKSSETESSGYSIVGSQETNFRIVNKRHQSV